MNDRANRDEDYAAIPDPTNDYRQASPPSYCRQHRTLCTIWVATVSATAPSPAKGMEAAAARAATMVQRDAPSLSEYHLFMSECKECRKPHETVRSAKRCQRKLHMRQEANNAFQLQMRSSIFSRLGLRSNTNEDFTPGTTSVKVPTASRRPPASKPSIDTAIEAPVKAQPPLEIHYASHQTISDVFETCEPLTAINVPAVHASEIEEECAVAETTETPAQQPEVVKIDTVPSGVKELAIPTETENQRVNRREIASKVTVVPSPQRTNASKRYVPLRDKGLPCHQLSLAPFDAGPAYHQANHPNSVGKPQEDRNKFEFRTKSSRLDASVSISARGL